MLERGKNYLLWDGDCEFCRRCYVYAEQLDKDKLFVMLPYQEVPEDELKEYGLDYHRCERELQVISESGRVWSGAFSVNYFLSRLERWKLLVALGFLFPVLFLLEVLSYRIVASNRYTFSKLLFKD